MLSSHLGRLATAPVSLNLQLARFGVPPLVSKLTRLIPEGHYTTSKRDFGITRLFDRRSSDFARLELDEVQHLLGTADESRLSRSFETHHKDSEILNFRLRELVVRIWVLSRVVSLIGALRSVKSCRRCRRATFESFDDEEEGGDEERNPHGATYSNACDNGRGEGRAVVRGRDGRRVDRGNYVPHYGVGARRGGASGALFVSKKGGMRCGQKGSRDQTSKEGVYRGKNRSRKKKKKAGRQACCFTAEVEHL